MIPAVNYDYHAVRTNPGVKGIKAAANNPANKTVFQHYVEKHCPEKDRIYKEEMTAQGKGVTTMTEMMLLMETAKPEHHDPRVSTLTFDEIYRHVIHRTGDEADRHMQAMRIYMSQQQSAERYPYENVDQKLYELRNLAFEARYEGMSEEEIFLSIYERYEQAFPGFMLASTLGNGYMPGFSKPPIFAIQQQYREELQSIFGSNERAREVHRTAFYGDKSDSEIRAEIVAKYPPPGKQTLKDVRYMLEEMRMAGVDEMMSTVLHEAIGCEFKYMEMNNKPFDIQWLANEHNSILNAHFYWRTEQIQNAHLLFTEIFGASVDSNGNVSANVRGSTNFSTRIEELYQKYYKTWTVSDWERFRDSL